MQNNVMYELTVFAGAGIAGVLLAFLYDLFRLKRRIVRTTPALVHIEDILYWLCAAVILFLFSYGLSNGETRVYFYLGSFLGGVTYLGLLSHPILWMLTTIIRILLWPFCEIIKFLKPIFRVILILFGKVKGKIKNRIALEGYRVRIDFFRLRNTFTKK